MLSWKDTNFAGGYKISTTISIYLSTCKKTIPGTSVEGREIYFLKISDNVATDENEAEVALDGGIHGDEPGGPENLIRRHGDHFPANLFDRFF
jgi:hypothetical protein